MVRCNAQRTKRRIKRIYYRVNKQGKFPNKSVKATEKTYNKRIGWFQTNLFHTVIYRHSIAIYPAQFEMVIFL